MVTSERGGSLWSLQEGAGCQVSEKRVEVLTAIGGTVELHSPHEQAPKTRGDEVRALDRSCTDSLHHRSRCYMTGA